MFEERIKEILELVFEVENKTDFYLNFSYDIETRVLCICTTERILTASNNKYMEESIREMKDYLRELIEDGEA